MLGVRLFLLTRESSKEKLALLKGKFAFLNGKYVLFVYASHSGAAVL